MFTHVLQTIRTQRGQGLLSAIIAAGLIAISIGGVGVSASRLSHAMKKAELANAATMLESLLVSEFHNSLNFPETATASIASPNSGLRDGSLTTLPLGVTAPFGLISVPISTNGATSVVTYLDKNLAPCGGAAFSDTCVLKMEVRLKKTSVSASLNNYSFAYQIDANPDLITMAPLGRVTSFNSPIDPGLYRVQDTLTHCDPVNDVFMTGINRDTGEAFCVRKPASAKCANKKLPKGLSFTRSSETDPGTLALDCTSAEMRTLSCPDNYSLWKFNPSYADPESGSFDGVVPGRCIFRTGHTAYLRGSYPPDPTSPYLSQVRGTFCPPYYTVSNASACRLVPNTTKNSYDGMGRCADTAYKNCTRTTYTTVSDGGSAHTTWATCMASATPPPSTCGTEPANPVISYTCNRVQTSADCDRVVTSGGPDCAVTTGWSGGTAYATNIRAVSPTATAVGSISGRSLSCSFIDTSPNCTAPALDSSGNPWGRKNPTWYGGVQVSGLQCNFAPTVAYPEEVNAN